MEDYSSSYPSPHVLTSGAKIPRYGVVLETFHHERTTMSLAPTTPTLPVELLAQIIIEAGAIDPSITAVVMRVSRLWYNITINEPRLWNKVSLNLGGPSSHVLAMQTSRRCIERSGSIDLDITIRITSIASHGIPSEYYQAGWQAYMNNQRGPIEVLAGSDGNHLARWCRLEILNHMTSKTRQALWVAQVLSPLIDGRPTPRLQTLSFRGWYDVRLSFCHTPLLQEVTLEEASSLHIANWGGVKKLRIAGIPPPSLVENGAYTVITHLILCVPNHYFQLTLPNVTDLEILDSPVGVYDIQLPTLPRVQNVSISTFPDHPLHNLPLERYPTMRRLSLRYPDYIRPASFSKSLSTFIISVCANLEELDVSYSVLDIVKSTSRELPNLKKLFVMGKEVESWP